MSRGFHRRITASEEAVRVLLAQMRAWLRITGRGEAECGTVEIALAEALNNIVEHAYAGSTGEIVLEAEYKEGVLRCILTDRGAGLPGLCLPSGDRPAIAPAAMPEGGFGWFLIRSLTSALNYAREGEENRLTLCFTLVRGAEDSA